MEAISLDIHIAVHRPPRFEPRGARREAAARGQAACLAFNLNQNNHSRFSFSSPLSSLTFRKRHALAKTQGLSAAANCSMKGSQEKKILSKCAFPQNGTQGALVFLMKSN
jgi:hypothetical protein